MNSHHHRNSKQFFPITEELAPQVLLLCLVFGCKYYV